MILLALSVALAQEAPAPAEAVAAVAAPDRSGPPPVVPPRLLDLPDWEEVSLSEAVTLRVVTVPGVRKVSVAVYQHRGGLDFDGFVTPVHHATGWLQDVATAGRSAEDVAAFEDTWDVDVWTAAGGLLRNEAYLTVPREDLDRGLELLADVLRAPAYPKRDLHQWQVERLRFLREEGPNSPSAVASSLLSYGWFPPSHPFGTRPDPAGVEAVRRKDLKARHARVVSEGPLTVLVVGDVSAGEAREALAPVVDGLGAPGAESEPPAFAPPTTSRVLAADMPEAEQATIFLRLPAPVRDHADRVAFQAVAWAYGGHFMSRINRNLREEKGWTYGAHARYGAGEAVGTFDVAVDVPVEHVAGAIAEIEAEMAGLVAEGVTGAELSAGAREAIAWWNRRLQTADSAGAFYQGLFEDEESLAARRARVEALAALDPERTREVAATWLGAEAPRQWVVVGAREAIAPQLADLGLPVTWIAPEDAVLGTFE